MNTYIVNFSGIGNGVMVMPVIQFLIREKIYKNIFCTENRLLKDPKIFKVSGVKNRLFTVNPMWRRFNKKDWQHINIFLEKNNITDIYNFRNENLEEYEDFKKEFKQYRYFDFDFKKLRVRKNIVPIYNDIFLLFKKYGFHNNQETCEWLNRFRVIDNTSTKIGIMVSASQKNKELNKEKYISLINKILDLMTDTEIIIFSGKEENEIDKAFKIIETINNSRCTYFEKIDLSSVISKLGLLKCLISNDTGLLHIAGAIGISAIGLYLSTDPRVWRPNTFSQYRCIVSNTMGKCINWKRYAGTCDHFYQTCEQARLEDIKSDDIYNALRNILKFS